MRVITLFILLFSFSANAEELYCDALHGKVEGFERIPESSFTEERAKAAIDSLSELVRAEDIVIGDYEIAQEHSFVFIKGYLFKRYLKQRKEKYGEADEAQLKKFCEFLKNEAFSWD